MKKGKLFVMEGACDGIGKSTQYEMLKDRLREEGESVISHHFPSYGTIQGAPVEEYLRGDLGDPKDLSPYFVNGLYAMDRASTWKKKLQKYYDKGNIILLDRYTTSSLIYQSALIEDLEKRKEFINYVKDFEYNKIGIKSPDGVIFLDAPYELISELRRKRENNPGVTNDIHEKNDDFMRKVYENAEFIADYLGFEKVRCDDGYKMRKKEDIHEEVYEIIKSKIK